MGLNQTHHKIKRYKLTTVFVDLPVEAKTTMAEENNFFTTSFVSLAQVSFKDADIPVALAVHPGEPFGNDAKC